MLMRGQGKLAVSVSEGRALASVQGQLALPRGAGGSSSKVGRVFRIDCLSQSDVNWESLSMVGYERFWYSKDTLDVYCGFWKQHLHLFVPNKIPVNATAAPDPIPICQLY